MYIKHTQMHSTTITLTSFNKILIPRIYPTLFRKSYEKFWVLTVIVSPREDLKCHYTLNIFYFSHINHVSMDFLFIHTSIIIRFEDMAFITEQITIYALKAWKIFEYIVVRIENT